MQIIKTGNFERRKVSSKGVKVNNEASKGVVLALGSRKVIKGEIITE